MAKIYITSNNKDNVCSVSDIDDILYATELWDEDMEFLVIENDSHVNTAAKSYGEHFGFSVIECDRQWEVDDQVDAIIEIGDESEPYPSNMEKAKKGMPVYYFTSWPILEEFEIYTGV